MKLKALAKAYKQAPQYLERLALEIEKFGLTLHVLERNGQAHDSSIDDLVNGCIHLCQHSLCRQSVGPIRGGVDRLEKMIWSSKFVGRLRTALEEKEALKIFYGIECARRKLFLAHDLNFEARTKHDPKNTLVLSTGLRGPQIQQHSRSEARTRDISQLMNDLLPLIAGSNARDSSHVHENDASEVDDEQVVAESEGQIETIHPSGDRCLGL